MRFFVTDVSAKSARVYALSFFTGWFNVYPKSKLLPSRKQQITMKKLDRANTLAYLEAGSVTKKKIVLQLLQGFVI
jgi:hypothetical protein